MKRGRILVVDDDVLMLHTVTRLLERDWDLAACGSASAALARAPGFVPDLALVDVRLPASDGFALMRTLKAAVPGLDVILMTGSLTDVDAKLIQSLREEAFFFLQKPFDREVLLTLLDRWADRRALARANAAYVAQLEAELGTARTFQRRMLPADGPIGGGLVAHGRYLPCEALGGDFYDWVDAGHGRGAMLIADVSGHGVAAAMLTGFVKAAFHAAHADGYAPDAVAGRVRDGLRGLDDGAFVSLLAVRIDPRAGTLEHTCCGHPYAAVVREGSSVAVTACVPILSPAFPDVACERVVETWRRGDRLVAWTDGLEEAVDPAGEMFGTARVHACLEAVGDPATLLAGIERRLSTFVGARPLRDDVTLVAVG